MSVCIMMFHDDVASTTHDSRASECVLRTCIRGLQCQTGRQRVTECIREKKSWKTFCLCRPRRGVNVEACQLHIFCYAMPACASQPVIHHHHVVIKENKSWCRASCIIPYGCSAVSLLLISLFSVLSHWCVDCLLYFNWRASETTNKRNDRFYWRREARC